LDLLSTGLFTTLNTYSKSNFLHKESGVLYLLLTKQNSLKLLTISIWTCVIFVSAQLVAKDKPIKIVDHNIFCNPALNSSYYIDKENSLKIHDIIQPEYQHKFIDNTSEILNFGMVSSTIWIKFSIQSLLDVSPYLEIDNPALDTIEYYLYNSKGILVHHHATGNYVNIEDRSLNISDLIIDMKLGNDEVYTCYLKANSKSSSILMPMRIAPMKKYYEVIYTKSTLQGLYFGFILFLFIYNVFLFFSLKDSSYIYFAFFIACIGLLFALFKGFGMQYIWNNFPYVNQLTPLIGAVAGIFIILFRAKFLNSKSKTPKLHLWLLSLMAFYVIVIGLNLGGIQYYSTKLLEYNSAVVLIFIVFIAIKRLNQGYKPAKYFLFAWSFYVIGFITYLLRDNGWIV